MTPIKDLSIKSKMTGINMLTTCIALLLACVALVAYQRFSFRNNLVSDLSTLAEITGKNCIGTLDFDRPDSASGILANLGQESQIIASCIYKDGKVWAKHPPT